MKAILEVVKFNVSDIVTASSCDGITPVTPED